MSEAQAIAGDLSKDTLDAQLDAQAKAMNRHKTSIVFIHAEMKEVSSIHQALCLLVGDALCLTPTQKRKLSPGLRPEISSSRRISLQ
jgi:hypothetical protein